MELDLFSKLTDAYERKARLYPAMLVLVPPVTLAVSLLDVAPKLDKGLAGMLVTFGVLYLLATIARELGKRREGGLFESWGGKPTTQALRHRHPMFDPVTKARYHSFLGKHLGMNFPTAADEQRDPIAADNVYQAAGQWLLEKTRDRKKFGLLFLENIAYGFRRNCLGLRPLGIAVALASLLFLLITIKVVTTNGVDPDAFAKASKGAWLSLIVSLVMLATWAFFFTERTVKTAAFAYAEMLIRACDVLPKKR